MPVDYSYKRGSRYFNPHHKSYHPESIADAWEDFTLWCKEVFLWVTGLKSDPEITSSGELKKQKSCFYTPKAVDGDLPKAIWINHSSFLLQAFGLTFLTDPIWSQRCSPIRFIGPKRKQPPALHLDNIPPVDYVFISHNHYDHLDERTITRLKKLFPKVNFLVPRGCRDWFLRRGLEARELGWWESIALERDGVKLRFTAVPAQHFSGRNLICLDHNNTLWAGWVVELYTHSSERKAFYFCGDTGYNPIDFREIGRKLGPLDLSLIPVGAYLPRKICATIHANPYEAVIIHREVGSRLSLACHHSTFELGQEPLEQPPFDLARALEVQGISPSEFFSLRPGAWINW